MVYIYIYIVHMLPSWVWYSTHAAQLGHLQVLPNGLVTRLILSVVLISCVFVVSLMGTFLVLIYV